MANTYKTFTAGSVLTAADLNTYLMRQVLIGCDSATDYPTSAIEGMHVYDRSLDAVLVYNGVAWRPPWNLPWGLVAHTTVASTAIGSTSEITAGTLTVDLVANRRYKVSAIVGVLNNASAYNVVRIRRDSATVVGASQFRHAVGIWDYSSIPVEALDTVTAGSHTYTLTVQSLQTPGGGATTDGTNTTTLFKIEDVGPAGGPA